MVSHVTRVATRPNSRRPNRWPSAARRRRSWSSRRSRRPARRTFSTRLSSRRNAIMSSCSRWRQAYSTAKTNWNGDTVRSLLQRWSIVSGTLWDCGGAGGRRGAEIRGDCRDARRAGRDGAVETRPRPMRPATLALDGRPGSRSPDLRRARHVALGERNVCLNRTISDARRRSSGSWHISTASCPRTRCGRRATPAHMSHLLLADGVRAPTQTAALIARVRRRDRTT
jgi:hypothetical protein